MLKNYTVAIVEDEKAVRDMLAAYFERFGKEMSLSFQVTGYESGDAFLAQYQKDKDLILFDIQMPGTDGIETAKRIRAMDENVVIVFVTNMAQYALKGYEVNAVDFAVKPVSYDDFVLRIKKAIRYVKQDTNLVFQTIDGKTVNLFASEVTYIEVRRHYLTYHTLSEKYTARGSMKEAEEKLFPYHFRLCNSCYLVNLAHVVSMGSDEVEVGAEKIQMSRRRRNEFLQEFTEYAGGF
jgi:two-component system response regulator LytT